jgi:hypothetical protein
MTGHTNWGRGRSRPRLIAIAALGLVIGLTAGACASAGSSPASNNVGRDAAAAPSGVSGGGGANGSIGKGAAGQPGDVGAVPGQQGPGPVNAPVTDPALIIRTGGLTIEVSGVDESIVRAGAAITAIGGYVSGSQQSRDGDRSVASVTYGIPSGRWDDALAAMKALGKVLEGQTSSAEVTTQVLDLGARIDNLKASERALQSIMVRATKIPDILSVQSQLTAVRGEIEQLSTQQAHLREQAALSTLTVLFQTPAVPKVVETSQGWNAGTEFDHAVGQLLGLGQGLATAGIWLVIVVLPLAIVAFVLLGIAAIVARRLRRMRDLAAPPASVGGTGA